MVKECEFAVVGGGEVSVVDIYRCNGRGGMMGGGGWER